jgi:hypothetical protein
VLPALDAIREYVRVVCTVELDPLRSDADAGSARPDLAEPDERRLCRANRLGQLADKLERELRARCGEIETAGVKD